MLRFESEHCSGHFAYKLSYCHNAFFTPKHCKEIARKYFVFYTYTHTYIYVYIVVYVYICFG